MLMLIANSENLIAAIFIFHTKKKDAARNRCY